jgi:hypothetical protein
MIIGHAWRSPPNQLPAVIPATGLPAQADTYRVPALIAAPGGLVAERVPMRGPARVSSRGATAAG